MYNKAIEDQQQQQQHRLHQQQQQIPKEDELQYTLTSLEATSISNAITSTIESSSSSSSSTTTSSSFFTNSYSVISNGINSKLNSVVSVSIVATSIYNLPSEILITGENVNFKWVMKEKKSARDNWRNGKYEVTTLVGHSEPISSILFNGESIISSSYDKSLRVWDYSSAECKLVIPTNDVECMQLDHTNKQVITGTKNGHINLWDITDGTQKFSEKGHLYFISSLKGNYNSTLFCSGAKDKTIKLWDVLQNKMVSSIGFPKSALLNIEWCEDQKNHIVVSGGNILSLIDVETGQTVRNFQGHTNDIHCFSVVDGLIASSGIDETIKVWDKRDVVGTKSIKVDATVYCLKFQPSHNIIITGSNDHTVSSYRLDSGRLEYHFIGHQNPISVLHLDKERIVSGSLDKNLYVWNCNTDISGGPMKMGKYHKLDAHQGMIRCAYFDDTKIISGSYDKTIRVWDFSGAKNNTKKTCNLISLSTTREIS
ncbi:WD40 repeat-containing protein [Heterostelium album PN500]|uniref:WD40 repeat-containing protein n=1 Tax=Heterostelium pallidum (strain ATCC 26659 / Pp 5 / PN500) TaxID=670386 RepID=D3B1R1_HETP5|nr:WD40 repeat-containing protein [Heterostelium album PN500]EFA85235.1 WD40 repeat-containing protein [Heterostelium album PN500]|eukprot:XP_020437344.1 WD40 repeat-containing protein [Heterostelium album PN500]